MKNLTRLIAAVLVLAFSFHAFAQDPKIKGKKHPRRKEVIDRAINEKNKNNAAAVDGKITDEQARKLDRQDNRIERQEQREAKANGGYITKGEQKQLNREENRINQERNAMEKKDAAINQK